MRLFIILPHSAWVQIIKCTDTGERIVTWKWSETHFWNLEFLFYRQSFNLKKEIKWIFGSNMFISDILNSATSLSHPCMTSTLVVLHGCPTLLTIVATGIIYCCFYKKDFNTIHTKGNLMTASTWCWLYNCNTAHLWTKL